MSHFMILATYSVRMQADTAPQGQFLPMITLYYILSIGYAFLALVWFIVAENWATKQNVPKFLVTFSGFIKRFLFWIFDEEPIWKMSKKIAPEKVSETAKLPPVNEQTSNVTAQTNESVIFSEEKKEEQAKKVCFTCDFCENCKKVIIKDLIFFK